MIATFLVDWQVSLLHIGFDTLEIGEDGVVVMLGEVVRLVRFNIIYNSYVYPCRRESM